MTAVFKKELKAYFNSMVGYVFIALLLVVTGIYFLGNNLLGGHPQFSSTLTSVMIVFMVAIPILTMRSMAEEKRSRTDQMLLTYPVSVTGIVFGKYFAMVMVLLIPMLLFCLCPVIICANGASYFAADYATIFAFFVMGCVFIAVGQFISAITESQIISAVGTFVALLLIFLWGDIANFFPSPICDVLGTFVFRDVFYNFSEYNVFDVGGIIFYLSIAALFVFLTEEVLRRRRDERIAVASVLAISLVVVLNLIVGLIPESRREIDISNNRIYSLSSEATEYLGMLDQSVELVVTSSEEDAPEKIVKFLHRFAAESDRITLRFVDPVSYPSVLENYSTQSNCIAVRSLNTGKTTSVPFADIIRYDETYMMYYQQYVETEFDGEGQIISAIDYVTGDTAFVVYQDVGHGEQLLPMQVTEGISKLNLKLDSVNLMRNGIPDDCNMLIFFGPTSDLADDELTMLRTFLADGGQLVFLAGNNASVDNWNAILGEYGYTLGDGFVADPSRYYQATNNPYAIFPVLSSDCSITSPLTENDLVLLMYSFLLNSSAPVRNTINVTPFMVTSENGFAVSAASESSVSGTYTLGAVAEEGKSRVIIFASSSLINPDLLDSFSNMANLKVFLRAVVDGVEGTGKTSIPAKSLELRYNVVENALLWGLLYTAVFPVVILVGGLIRWTRRRKQ